VEGVGAVASWRSIPSALSLIVQQLAVLLDSPARAAGLCASVAFNMGVKDDFRIPDRSEVVDLSASELANRIDWPPSES
jgi:hypothetical protein